MVLNTKGLVYLHLPYLFINLPDGCIQSDSHMMHKNTQTKTHSFFSSTEKGKCKIHHTKMPDSREETGGNVDNRFQWMPDAAKERETVPSWTCKTAK